MKKGSGCWEETFAMREGGVWWLLVDRGYHSAMAEVVPMKTQIFGQMSPVV